MCILNGPGRLLLNRPIFWPGCNRPSTQYVWLWISSGGCPGRFWTSSARLTSPMRRGKRTGRTKITIRGTSTVACSGSTSDHFPLRPSPDFRYLEPARSFKTMPFISKEDIWLDPLQLAVKQKTCGSRCVHWTKSRALRKDSLNDVSTGEKSSLQPIPQITEMQLYISQKEKKGLQNNTLYIGKRNVRSKSSDLEKMSIQNW